MNKSKQDKKKSYTLEDLQWVQERTKVKAVKDYKLQLKKEIERVMTTWELYWKKLEGKETITIKDAVEADIETLRFVIYLLEKKP